MKYVGRSSTAPEHKAIKESSGKCSQLEILNVHFVIEHIYTDTQLKVHTGTLTMLDSCIHATPGEKAHLNIPRRVCTAEHTFVHSKTRARRYIQACERKNAKKQTPLLSAFLPLPFSTLNGVL